MGVPAGGPADLVARARRLADDRLFPAAPDTDRARLVPVSLLDAMAAAGLYGLVGPPEAGGLGADERTRMEVVEALAGACLTTTFVWAQHHAAVAALSRGPAAMREIWLAPMCAGHVRSGVAFTGLRRPGPPVLVATPVDAGWRLDGQAPWVSGWGRVDVVLVAARSSAGDVVWALVDAVASDTLAVRPLDLGAVAASGTVTVDFSGHAVPAERVVAVEAWGDWQARDRESLRPNGALAIGVAGRCCALLGPSPLDAALVRCRDELLSAGAGKLPRARAAASALAMRAACALFVETGGSAVLLGRHPERLLREAGFLLVFGQTAEIRAAEWAVYG